MNRGGSRVGSVLRPCPGILSAAETRRCCQPTVAAAASRVPQRVRSPVPSPQLQTGTSCPRQLNPRAPTHRIGAQSTPAAHCTQPQLKRPCPVITHTSDDRPQGTVIPPAQELLAHGLSAGARSPGAPGHCRPSQDTTAASFSPELPANSEVLSARSSAVRCQAPVPGYHRSYRPWEQLQGPGCSVCRDRGYRFPRESKKTKTQNHQKLPEEQTQSCCFSKSIKMNGGKKKKKTRPSKDFSRALPQPTAHIDRWQWKGRAGLTHLLFSDNSVCHTGPNC